VPVHEDDRRIPFGDRAGLVPRLGPRCRDRFDGAGGGTSLLLRPRRTVGGASGRYGRSDRSHIRPPWRRRSPTPMIPAPPILPRTSFPTPDYSTLAVSTLTSRNSLQRGSACIRRSHLLPTQPAPAARPLASIIVFAVAPAGSTICQAGRSQSKF